MKFSIAATALLSFFSMGVFSAPTSIESDALSNGIEARTADEVTVFSVMTELYADVQIHTGKINGTYTGLSKSAVSLSQNTVCIATIKAELSAICDIMTSATTKLHGCKGGADIQIIVGLCAKIFLEIMCTINGVIAFFGASALWMLSFSFNLCISVMANLLLVVEASMGGVIALVWGMVSGVINIMLPGVGSLFFGLGNTLHGQCGCVSQ
ncbi:hypothetical protein SLS57_004484 [Botryosphaeria dothidea]